MGSLITLPSGSEAKLPANMGDGFWLPPETPFGNLQRKYLQILQRLGHANMRLAAAYEHWSQFFKGAQLSGVDHGSLELFNTEEAIAAMRRAADELIAIESFLTDRLQSGNYPVKLRSDSIGHTNSSRSPIYRAHEGFLVQLNEVSNAHKHSFLQTSVSAIGAQEAGVMAYPLKHNNLEADEGFYTLRLSNVVDDFSAFFATAHNEIHKLAAQLGPNQGAATAVNGSDRGSGC